MGMDLKEDDYIEHLFVASTHDYILFFTTVGKVYRLKVHELPLGSRQSKGRAIVNLLPFRQDEQVRAVIATRNFEEAKYLVFGTKKGIVKKTEFKEYNTPLKADGIIAIKMREDDELIGVRHSNGRRRRADGVARRAGGPLPRAGRPADGPSRVRRPGHEAARRRRGDRARHRRGRRRAARRDRERLGQAHARLRVPGQGPRRRWASRRRKLAEGKGKLAGAHVVRDGYQVMLISDGGTVIRMPVDGIKRSGRATQGVIVMRLREGEQVSTLAPVTAATRRRTSRRRRGTPATDLPAADEPPSSVDSRR